MNGGPLQTGWSCSHHPLWLCGVEGRGGGLPTHLSYVELEVILDRLREWPELKRTFVACPPQE